MFINKVLKLCVLVIFVNTTFTCSYNKNKEENHIESESIENKKLSPTDIKLIDEYNQIVNKYLTDDENKFQQELRLFIPKALQIESKTEKNNILMNIYANKAI